MRKDITNQKFGKLVAVKSSEKKDSHNCFLWICICECGKETTASVAQLTCGVRKSCGCLKNRPASLNPTWKGAGELSGQRFYNFKKNALRRNILFSVSVEDLWALFLKQNKKCNLTGDELSFEKNSENVASLDRIDNEKGYEISNLQWVRADINSMKMGLTQQKFLDLCARVVKNQN
jgi:hypothetical protein